MTQLFLRSNVSNDRALISIYRKAVSEAVKLYIFSVYLTHWDVENKLSSKLQELKFISGQDFGLSKEEVIRKVLKWLPSHLKFTLMAAQGIQDFHPKAVFWENDKGEYYALVGSSNLTHAAFNSSYEANTLAKISEQDFIKVKSWANEVTMKSIPVSEDWLKGYRETEISHKKSTSNRSAVDGLSLKVPPYNHELVEARREQMRKHQTVREGLKSLVNQCASGKTGNGDFYVKFNKLWSWEDEDKGKGIGNCFQDKTWMRKGKSSDFRKLYYVIQAVFDTPPAGKNSVTVKQIGWLEECGVPTRRSVFSKMLYREYPDKYPLLNEPVRKFLRNKDNEFRSAHGTSEGSRYIDLSIKLRVVLVKQSKIKDLAELDVLIQDKYRR